MRQHIEKKQSALFRALLSRVDRELKQSQKKIPVSSGFTRTCFGTIVLAFVLCFAASVPAYAGRAVSVTGGNWAIGSMRSGQTEETTGETYTVTNDGSEGSYIYIKAEGTNWNPGSSAGEDTFVLKHDVSGSWSSAITNTNNGITLALLASAGTKTFDLQFTPPSSTTVGGEHTLTVTLTATKGWVCGEVLTIYHTQGSISPVTAVIGYPTVSTSLTRTTKCWTTRNLGASEQQISVADPNPNAVGWYWQFNRKQGYAIGPTPAWTINSIDEDSDWISAEDPCTQLLGTGWRLPTSTEYSIIAGGWSNYNYAYASVLKMHICGMLGGNGGVIYFGSRGYFVSSSQCSNGISLQLYIGTKCYVNDYGKAGAYNARCLKD